MRTKKEPPLIVQYTILLGDKGALSRLGRAGAKRKKEIIEEEKKRKLQTMLRFAYEIAHEANEDICPLK